MEQIIAPGCTTDARMDGAGQEREHQTCVCTEGDMDTETKSIPVVT